MLFMYYYNAYECYSEKKLFCVFNKKWENC